MTATNRDKPSRLQLSGRDIAGVCLTVCSLLIIIWGGTLESASVADPNSVSFAVSGLAVVVAGVCLVTTPPRTACVTLIWLATLTSMPYLFILGTVVIVSLMSCVVIAGIAAWLIIRIPR